MHRAHRGFILEGSKFSTKQFSIIETGAERRTTTWNPKIAFSWRCLQVFYQIGKCSGRSTPTSLCKTDFISGTFNSHPGSFHSISKWRRKWKIGEQIIRLERVEIVCLFRYRYLRKLQNWPIFQMPLSWRLDISIIHVNKHKLWMLWTSLVIWYSFLPSCSTRLDILLYWILCIHSMHCLHVMILKHFCSFSYVTLIFII